MPVNKGYSKKFSEIYEHLQKNRGLENGIPIKDIYQTVFGTTIDSKAAYRLYVVQKVNRLVGKMKENKKKNMCDVAVKDNKVFIPKNAEELDKKTTEYMKQAEGTINNTKKFVDKNAEALTPKMRVASKEVFKKSLVMLAKKLAGEKNEEK